MTQQIIEELIITPSDYPTRIDMSNPHPSANVKLGIFDPTTGEKVTDENTWQDVKEVPGFTGDGYLSSMTVNNGFSFIVFSDFNLMVYRATVSRKMKIFEDGELIQEVELAGESGFVPVEVNFSTKKAREITVVQTEGFMSVDCIIPTPANLPVLQNPGTVADYPVLEVESADTEAMFSPLGKKVGDDTHPFKYTFKYADDLLSLSPDVFVETASQTLNDGLYFLNSQMPGQAYTKVKGSYTGVVSKWDLKSPQSPYYGMTATEIKDHIQSILSEHWGYAKGAIEVGDPSFESGTNGFAYLNGVTATRSSEWAKTGNNSLKLVSNGSNQWASAGKSYGNQAGKKITAKLTIYNPPIGGAQHSIHFKWYDATNGADLAQEYIDLALGQEGTYELEAVVPANCDDVRLYIYPTPGVSEPATIYIDDVTATACGIDVRIWTDGDHWSSSSRFHHLDFPSLVTWDLDAGNNPSRFVDSNGIVCLLAMAKYPSDGISSSAVYIDHCRLGTTMNCAKLGVDAITNYGGNLLPAFTDPAWEIHTNARVLGGYELELNADEQYQFSRCYLSALPSTEYYLQVQSGEYIVQYYDANGVNLAGQGVPSSGSLVHNRKFLTPPECVEIKIGCYNAEAGRFLFKNPMLTQTSEAKPFRPQDKYILGFSNEQAFSKNEILTIDGTALHVKKNDASIVDSLSSTFSTNGFKLAPGLNHFKTSHIGGNMKIRVIKESMPKIAAFDGIYFPAVESIAKSKKKTGDKEETAGGKLRQDIVRIRRIWDVETGKLTKEEADELIDHLESKLYGSGDFWLAEFGGGGNTIEAYIDPNNLKEEIVPFGKDGWHPDGRRLSFQVEER